MQIDVFLAKLVFPENPLADRFSQVTWNGVRLSLNLGGPGRLVSDLALENGTFVLADNLRLMAGQRYTYNLTMFGRCRSKLYEVLDVPLDGKFELKIDLIYQAPSVIVPGIRLLGKLRNSSALSLTTIKILIIFLEPFDEWSGTPFRVIVGKIAAHGSTVLARKL